MTSNPSHEVDSFLRKLRNLESMYRRLDSGELTGRNSDASDAGREHAYCDLANLYDEACADDDNPLPEYLDDNPSVAARWHRMERRCVGLPV